MEKQDNSQNLTPFPRSRAVPAVGTNEIGFPLYPETLMNLADKIWRQRKRRAEAMYALVILLAREIRERSEIYGGANDWFFDTLSVKEALAGAGIEFDF